MELRFKKLSMNPEIKDKFKSIINSQSLEITYFNGYLVEFDKSNIQSISPHKIVIGNDEKNLLVMTYSDYAEHDDLYYVDGIKDPFTITSLKKYVKNYFENECE